MMWKQTTRGERSGEQLCWQHHAQCENIYKLLPKSEWPFVCVQTHRCVLDTSLLLLVDACFILPCLVFVNSSNVMLTSWTSNTSTLKSPLMLLTFEWPASRMIDSICQSRAFLTQKWLPLTSAATSAHAWHSDAVENAALGSMSHQAMRKLPLVWTELMSSSPFIKYKWWYYSSVGLALKNVW